jgi:hypothetical protein
MLGASERFGSLALSRHTSASATIEASGATAVHWCFDSPRPVTSTPAVGTPGHASVKVTPLLGQSGSAGIRQWSHLRRDCLLFGETLSKR